MQTLRTETVIVGSGPGGASVARALARAGRPVVLLERGRDWRGHALYGTYPGALLYADRRALLFTREGMNIIRPLMVGGATSMYCGCSSPPRPWWQERYGIALDDDAADIARELHIRPLAAELRGPASTRVAEAGRALGMPWEPQDKFMQPERAHPFDCGARCMLGCRCGAKWNAAEWVDDAVAAGATVLTRAHVDRVRIENGHATGVIGRTSAGPLAVEAEHVVVAAGGIGSATLLRRSGLAGAGRGITMDTTAMVYAHVPRTREPAEPAGARNAKVARDDDRGGSAHARGDLSAGDARRRTLVRGMGADPPMTWSCPDDELGVLYSTLVDPWLMYPIIMATKGPRYPLTWRRWGRTLGVMIKLKDERSGEIDDDGRISKGLTDTDRQRLARAEAVAANVLKEAGGDPDTIFPTPLRGTHPSGTVPIGPMLSTDLETEVAGLYVCDASVFPEALGRPTVLTILALGRRLARHLL